MKAFSKKSLSLLVLGLTGAVACGSFVGCGSDDDDNNNTGTPDGGGTGTTKDGGGTGTTKDGGGTTVTPDGGGSKDSGTDSGPVDAGPSGFRTGSVVISQSHTLTYSTYAAAVFLETTTDPTIPVGYSCTAPAAAGTSCTYTDCTYVGLPDAGVADAGDAGDAGDASITLPEAALVTITGGSGSGDPTGGIQLTPSTTSGAYSVTTPATPPGFSTTAPIFAGGDSLVFKAVGDPSSIGTFTTTVVAPGDINLTAPAVSVTEMVTTAIPRGTDLAVTWTGGTQNTKLAVSLTSTTVATKEYKTVSCNFDAFANSGTVPSAGGLANLFQVDGTTVTGRLAVTPINTATTTASDSAGTGDWKINTQATATAINATYTNQ